MSFTVMYFIFLKIGNNLIFPRFPPSNTGFDNNFKRFRINTIFTILVLIFLFIITNIDTSLLNRLYYIGLIFMLFDFLSSDGWWSPISPRKLGTSFQKCSKQCIISWNYQKQSLIYLIWWIAQSLHNFQFQSLTISHITINYPNVFKNNIAWI